MPARMRAKPSKTSSTADRPLVLVVDDSVDVVRLLALLLSEKYDVIFATNGATGLELAIKRQPSLILLDLEMPGMNGREVWQRLRANEATQQIPVVFVSADAVTCGEGDDARIGQAPWIRKPFAAQVVHSTVAACLATGVLL